MKAELGVPVYSAALRRHNALFEGLGAKFPDMRIVKNMGDGYFAIFAGIADAVRFALLFQHAMRVEPWGTAPLKTRVGIHAGEVSDIETLGQADVVAPAADMAARIMSLALGGQILLTRTPFDEARHFLREHPPIPGGNGAPLPALRWLAHGPYRAKGADDALDVFEVGADELAPLMPPPDSGKVKRAIRAGEEDVLGWRPAVGLEVPERPGWMLVQRLGAGGFGEVWVAEHAKLGEKRAFKFCFDDDRLRGLKREVTLTRLLRTVLGDREDIVRFYELKLDEPPFYLESEYAPEGNLLQWAEKQGGFGKIPMETRIEIAAAAATSLAAAHSVGVLHKDIKPANILIFRDDSGRPRPRLVDFGIGTLSDDAALERHGVTGAGFTMASMQNSSGTPLYSPPEFLAGRPYTVQGDVYGLGVMLYQMVIGDPEKPLAPGWERYVSDPLLREDIAVCVDGDPAQRLAGTAELATRLRALPERRAAIEQAAKAAATEQARRRRQRTAIFGGAAAVAVALLTVPLTLWALKEKNLAVKAKEGSDAATVRAVAGEELARTLVMESSRADFATAQARFAESKWQEAVAYLGRALRYDPQNRNAREALWLALLYGQRDAGRLPMQALRYEAPINHAVFTPDGTRILTITDDGSGRMWDAATGRSVGNEVKLGTSVLAAAVSPDGKRIATAAADDVVQLWNATTGRAEGAPMQHPGPVVAMNFTADGALLVTDSTDRTPRIWDTATAKQVNRFDAVIAGGDRVAISPDGKLVAVSNAMKPVSFTELSTNVSGRSATNPPGNVTHLLFSPDSTRVLAAGDGWARIWNAADGSTVGRILRFPGKTVTISFSADGSRYVVGSDMGRTIIRDTRSGLTIGPPFVHGTWQSCAALSPDGATLFTASRDKAALIWPVAAAPLGGLPLPHRKPVERAWFSDGGARVDAVEEGGSAASWDAATGKPLPPVKWDPMTPNPRVTTGDGKRQLVRKNDSTVELREMATGFAVGKPMEHVGFNDQEALSADGTRAVTMPETKTAQLGDPASGKPVGERIKHQDYIEAAVFSQDSARLLTATAIDGARITDAREGRPIAASPPIPGSIDCAAFLHDGECFVIGYAPGLFQIYDSMSGLPLGPAIAHSGAVKLALPSPAGSRLLTGSNDLTVRVWETPTLPALTPETVEDLAAFACGARLDRRLGTLAPLSTVERMDIWEKRLQPALASLPAWRFAAERSLALTPQGLVSLESPMTVREAASRLIAHLGGTADGSAARVREAQGIDPSHPVMPLALALAESVKEEQAPENPARAAWLCELGLKRLASKTSAEDLRMAASLLLQLEPFVKGQKAAALGLLDRAKQLSPEDAEAAELRKQLGN